MPDYGALETDALLSKMEKRMNTAYRTANTEMNRKLRGFMKDYNTENKAKRSDLKAGKITKEDYEKWKLSKAGEKRWLDEMVNTLSEDAMITDMKAMSIVRGFMPEAYAINRNYGAFQVEAGALVDTSFTLYDAHTVERIIEERPNLLPKPKPDIPKEMRWHKQKINNAITQGILQGEAIPDIARRLQEVTDMDSRAAIRNARTATTAAQNAGRVDSYKDAKKMGIDVKQQWIATLDGRTRDSHRMLDGEIQEVGKKFSNGCEYPGDPNAHPSEIYNCRCTLIAVINGESAAETEGLFEYEVDGMSYDEWKKGKSKKKEDAEEASFDDIIKRAREFSPSEHEQINFSYDFWNGLSNWERRGVQNYTGSYYRKMNGVLRGSYSASDVSSQIIHDIENCTNALDKTSIAEDTLLYRGMGSVYSLGRSLGISESEAMSLLSDRGIIGQRFTERGFCSTGVNSGAGWDKEVCLEIIAPRGTKGMYVDPISSHHGEEELLLQKGTTFEVYDMYEKGDWAKIYVLRVIVVGQ